MNKIKLFLFISVLLFVCNSLSGNSEISNDTIYTEEEARSIAIEMGNEFWSLRERDYNLAIDKGYEAIKFAEFYGLDDQIARLSNFIGVLHNNNLYNSEKALSYFHKAMELSIKLNDSIQLAYAYNNLADVFFNNGNISLSYDYTLKSLEIFTNLKNEKGIAYAFINLGAINQKEQKFDLALRNFNSALAIRKARNDTLGQNQVLISIAETYLLMNKLEEALDIYSESNNQLVKRGNKLYSGICLLGIGNVYYKHGKMKESIDYFKKAKELFIEQNIITGLNKCYIGMALAYAQIGDREKGEEALASSRILSKQAKLRDQILNNHKYEAEFYMILGKYKEAFDVLSQYVVLNDSVLELQKMEVIDELQNGYVIQQNIDALQEELEDRKSNQQYLLVIITLMISAVGLFLWRYTIYRRLSKKLIKTAQTKDKLFSVISHDLKSPFNSILGFSEVLIDVTNNKDYNKIEQYARIINKSSKKNLKLLNNLLDWTRSQTGKFKYQPDVVNLDALFKTIEDFFTTEATKNKIELTFNSSISKNILADTNILRTILINLIANAIKYTNSEGHINVSAEIKNSKVYISVTDDGIGMSETIVNSLFKPSGTDSIKGVRDELGTGLGLIICSELIGLHKGNIKVRSKVGIGSTFVISFPYKISN